MLTRYSVYGLIGLLIEIFWTGLASLISGNLALTGHTYIWMFFIYGLAVFLEPVHDKIRREHFLIRGTLWSLIIFTIEFISGFVLDTVIGICPWDYSYSTSYTILGYIRLDYMPAWFFAGIFFEKLHDYIDKNISSLIKS